jgi:hypothetical protein
MQGQKPEKQLKPVSDKVRVCDSCKVELGFGDCERCAKFAHMRRYQHWLRVKKTKTPQGEQHNLVPEGAAPGEPYIRLFRPIGRNEKCPCGSGKKYKKCCIDRAEPKADETMTEAVERNIREASDQVREATVESDA